MSLCAKFHAFVPICAMVQLTALTISRKFQTFYSSLLIASFPAAVEEGVLCGFFLAFDYFPLDK